MELLKRLLKSALFACMMFFSLRYLGFSTSASLAFSLVPLVLGTINIMTGFAYSLTAIVFVLACASALFPDWQAKGDKILHSISQTVIEKNKERPGK
jgi:hypothetical protein